MYYTGNRSVTLATNWIFDHPELDLETPLEEELQRLEAEEAEDDDDDLDDEEEDDSDEEAMMIRQHHMFHQHHHHQTHQASHSNGHYVHHNHHHCLHDDDEEDEPTNKAEIYYDVSDETDSDSDDFDEDDIPEFKMVFVVNTSLEMGPGKIAAQVGHAALGVQRVLTAKAGQNKYKVSTADIGLWQDFG